MSSPFLAEIRVFAFNFPPTGWAFCNGQLMPISQNTALFALLGTVYGGDGKSTFGLPNMIDNAAMAPFSNSDAPYALSQHDLGEQAGSQFVTLLTSEMPVHSHAAQVSRGTANEREPGDQRFAIGDGINLYNDNTQPTTTMNPGALGVTGGSLPHNNMQPYLAMNYCIALQGVFPARGT